MPEVVLNNFSAGWCPSDDATGGRKNALLRMDNVELDQNGAIVMSGGTLKVNSAYSNTIHSLFARFLVNTQYIYAADTAGNIFRNNTNIGSVGSTTRAGFGSAFDFVLICSGAVRVRDDHATTSALGQGTASVPAVALNGAGVLTGSYDYAQVNIFNSGAYQARSAPSPLVTIVTAGNKVAVTPTAPSGVQNEVWIFRRTTSGTAGLMDQYYRVKRITSSYTTPFDDNLNDLDAINDGHSLNPAALPVDSTNFPDDIIEIVGPVAGRMFYFTKNAVFPSEVNSPESYVSGQGNYFMGSATTSEIFYWAKKVGNNVVLIGTSHDVYRMTGTFISLPDGTLDMFVKPLGVDAQPISRDADLYQGNVVYMSPYGWVICDVNGTIEQLCAPNTDRIYRGNTCYTNGGVPINILPQLRYSCAVIRNKLYVRVPEIVGNNPAASYTYRMEMYDFARKYWRAIRFVSNNAPDMLFGAEDDSLFGYFDNDKFVKYIDYQFSKNFDNASSVNQTVNLLTLFQDFGLPRNRKDSMTLKLRINTGNSALTYTIYTNDDQSTTVKTGTITANGFTEVVIDLTTSSVPLLLKSLQLLLTGQVADFALTDISLAFEPRPEQVTIRKLLRQDIPGVDGKRFRPRTWPLLIDTLGQNVTFTPIMDGSALATSTINTNGKRTHLHYFATDIIGTDLSCVLSGGNIFELYSILNPEIVQIIPITTKFTQVGPIELHGTGVIRQLELRVLPIGGSVIPWTLYLGDIQATTGTFSCNSDDEDSYYVPVTRLDGNLSGRVFRLELGPTSFPFSVYYVKALVSRAGSQKDVENEWIDLNMEKQQ